MGSPLMLEDESVVTRRPGILITSSVAEMQDASKSTVPKAVTFSEKDPEVYEYEPEELECPFTPGQVVGVSAMPLPLPNTQHKMSCFEKTLLGGLFTLTSVLIVLCFIYGSAT